jgi:hypothetical protein
MNTKKVKIKNIRNIETLACGAFNLEVLTSHKDLYLYKINFLKV